MKALRKYVSEQKAIWLVTKAGLCGLAALGLSTSAVAGALATSSTTLSNFNIGFSTPNSIIFSGFSSGSASIIAPPGPYGGASSTAFASGNGAAFGTNTWVGTFSVTNPTSVAFSFTALSGMLADLTPGGLVAAANLNMTIDISDLLTSTPVFSWAPNGILDGILGGTETLDAFDLNQGVSQFGSLGTATFPLVSGQFAANSTSLGSGFYLVNISVSNSASVSSGGLPNGVPEPSALFLMGIGMMGLYFTRRKMTR